MAEHQARTKLKEAEYFLDQMREAQNLLNEDLFKYNLSAFLSALNSVPEFLLFDFAEKCQIGISRDDEGKVYLKDFDVAAKAQECVGKTEASDFMKFWHRWHDDLKKKHAIASRRNSTIHKGYPRLEKVGEEKKMVFVPTGSFNVSTPAVSGAMSFYSPTFGSSATTTTNAPWSFTTTNALASSSSSVQSWVLSQAPPDVKETFRLSDQDDKDAVDVYTEAYTDMKRFVEEAEKEKWKRKP